VKGNDAETDTSAEGAGDRRPDGPAVLRQREGALEVLKQEGSMKAFIRGWEYEPPALQDFMRLVGLVFLLAGIGTFVFKGPVADVLLGGVLVLCLIVIVAANRDREHMMPFRWVLLTALVVTLLVDYVVATPVTHATWRTVQGVFIVWLIAKRFDIRSYWREVMTPGNDQPF